MNALAMPASSFLGLSRPQKKGDFSETPTLGQIPKPTTGDRLYALGGLLLNAAGYRNNAADEFMQRESMRELLPVQAAQAQLQRAQDFAGWRQQYDYQVRHPRPSAPTSLQSNYEYLKSLDPALASQYLNNQTTAPPIVQRNQDGTFTVLPSGMIPRGPQASPPSTLPPDFDFGGPTPPASGGFP